MSLSPVTPSFTQNLQAIRPNRFGSVPRARSAWWRCGHSRWRRHRPVPHPAVPDHAAGEHAVRSGADGRAHRGPLAGVESVLPRGNQKLFSSRSGGSHRGWWRPIRSHSPQQPRRHEEGEVRTRPDAPAFAGSDESFSEHAAKDDEIATLGRKAAKAEQMAASATDPMEKKPPARTPDLPRTGRDVDASVKQLQALEEQTSKMLSTFQHWSQIADSKIQRTENKVNFLANSAR